MNISRTDLTDVKRVFCCYHAHCLDGFGAYWVVAKWARENGLPLLGYAAEYGKPFPVELLAPEDLLVVVDFSYDAAQLLEMASRVKQMILLDHHDSAIRALEPFARELLEKMWVELDPRHSGAVLAWLHFYSAHSLPQVLRHIEDRDLWKFALPNTKEVCRALWVLPRVLAVWDEEAYNLRDLEAQGWVLLTDDAQNIAAAVARANMVRIGDFEVPCVNSAVLISEIGHALCEKHPDAPFAAVYYDTVGNQRKYSLRGRTEGENVARIAEKFGGGGHPSAAGFTVFLVDSLLLRASKEVV